MPDGNRFGFATRLPLSARLVSDQASAACRCIVHVKASLENFHVCVHDTLWMYNLTKRPPLFILEYSAERSWLRTIKIEVVVPSV